MKIGILVFATGKYIDFIGPLKKSIDKYFMVKQATISVFCFTDSLIVPDGVIKMQWKHQTFPMSTLLRYHGYFSIRKLLSDMDYVYCCDADMLFVSPVNKEILGKSVAVLHPGYFNSPNSKFPYEKNKKSTAYIKSGYHYFCGGFNGGKTKPFLQMAKTISENVDADLKNNIVAKVHDESHLNRYYIDHPPSLILDPSYCYIEGEVLPFKPKLVALNKNHAIVRYSGFLMVLNYIKEQSFIYLIHKPIVKIKKLLCHDSYLSAYLWPLIPLKMTKHFNYPKTVKPGKLDLVSVAFNNPKLIKLQIISIKKYLRDDYSLTIADNSTLSSAQEEISNICRQYSQNYLRVPQPFFKINDGSFSQGLTMNWVYKNYIKPRGFSLFGFVDHDIYPFRRTNITLHLKKNNLWGLCQERGEKWYLWAGFCFFKNSLFKNFDPNFLPIDELDTGGGNWRNVYSKVNLSTIPKITHDYFNKKNPKIVIKDINQVQSMVKVSEVSEHVGDWLHTFGGSNWRNL